MTCADAPHTLTGAYVAHALEDDERAQVEEHLAHCDVCAQEVRELAETVARLGLALATAPRRGLRDDVLRRITTVRQDVPRSGQDAAPRPTPRRSRRFSRWALAACVAVAAAFGGTALWQHQRAQDARDKARQVQEEARERSQELAAVLGAPDARTRSIRFADGAGGTVVVSAGRDRAAFIVTGLPEPPRGKVYQLWFDDDGSMRRAGLVAGGQDAQAMLLDGPVGRATGMGITVEPAGGSARPTTEPLALMDFPTSHSFERPTHP
ncbi:anti-sigma factor [Streptomyces flavofungini]|uniref:anti-sigma factor n=1 Tax=Streptomyces flavofungini TaxID=68200 RepID=UPI0025B10CDE|nr:anti-sigma factor [Streptomyces flavofungini]WJV50363.1 anti-sigma factor [Streptomyces flavofungini]